MTHAKAFVWGKGKKHINFTSKRDVFGGIILNISLMLEQKDLEIVCMIEKYIQAA